MKRSTLPRSSYAKPQFLIKPLLLGVSLVSANALAASSTVNTGASLTTGPSSSSYSIQSAFSNPGMNPLLIQEDEAWRMSYFPNISFNTELGDVDNFMDDLDELIDLVDDSNSSTDSATDVLNRFNGILTRMGDTGYVKNSFSIDAPLFPLLFKSELLGGTIGFGLGADVQISTSVLDDPLRVRAGGSGFDTNTSAYVKTGVESTFSVSYGRELLSGNAFIADHGRLYGGVKVNVINMGLSKQVIPIVSLDGKDIGDVIRDEYDKNLERSTNVGVDLGLVWDAEDYRLGLTIENINEPEFEYGVIGEDCGSRGEQNSSRDFCETAAFFAGNGEINTRETHTKNALVRIDGMYKLTDRWLVASAYDTAEFDDITGSENQWLHVSTSYEASNPILSAARVGYQKNLAGTQLSSVNLGFTLFHVVSLDVEYGLDTTEVDGSAVPRRIGISLGVEEKF